ncbi:hypothetical protein IMZ48_06720 [Candidatus Bathyarchaeota archaeon]|nr:hypothetical protein [Candidatus Bathyarchaeota archaeon]
MPSLLILAIAAAAAAAQTTTVEIWTPIDGDGLVATVLGVNDATTTLGISCPKEAVEADECGLPGTDLFTHISGPSTVSYHYDNKLAEL